MDISYKILKHTIGIHSFPCGSDGKESACNADPWVGKLPWRKERLPTPVFLPREFHGQRSLVVHSPWGHRVGHD